MAFDLDVRAEGRIDEVQDFLEGGRGELSAQAAGFTGRMAGIKSNERDIVIFRELGENFWQRGDEASGAESAPKTKTEKQCGEAG